MASCVGKLASVAVRAKLDSGAEAANWIEPALVTKLRLRKRKILEKERRIYTNRLFTSSKGYSPEEMVSVKVYFQDWNFAIDITCCVFPELANPVGMPQEEIIIGDVDCNKYMLLKYAEKRLEPIQKLPPIPESLTIEDEMQDLDEVDPDRLHSGKFIHFRQITTDKTKSTTVSHWDDSQIGDMFPLGSAHRKDLEKILAKYDGDTLAESLRGKKLKVEPFNIGLKEGATFEGVPGRRYSEKHSEVLKEWVDTMLNEGIIEPCPTTTTSPALVVPQEGKYRVTSDVTQLNKVMKTLQGNIPAIDGIVRWYARKKNIKAY